MTRPSPCARLAWLAPLRATSAAAEPGFVRALEESRSGTGRLFLAVGLSAATADRQLITAPLGRLRYQRCACGRLRVLLAGDVLKDGPAPPRGPSPEEPEAALGRAAGCGEPAC